MLPFCTTTGQPMRDAAEARSGTAAEQLVVRARPFAIDLLRGRAQPAEDVLDERQRHFALAGVDGVRAGRLQRGEIAKVGGARQDAQATGSARARPESPRRRGPCRPRSGSGCRRGERRLPPACPRGWRRRRPRPRRPAAARARCPCSARSPSARCRSRAAGARPCGPSARSQRPRRDARGSRCVRPWPATRPRLSAATRDSAAAPATARRITARSMGPIAR